MISNISNLIEPNAEKEEKFRQTGKTSKAKEAQKCTAAAQRHCAQSFAPVRSTDCAVTFIRSGTITTLMHA